MGGRGEGRPPGVWALIGGWVPQADGGRGLSIVYAGSVLHLFEEEGTRRVVALARDLLRLGGTYGP
jgi:hypothetical protein